MGCEKCLSRCARVIASAIVDQKQVRRGLCHDHLQERLVTVRVKPAFNALREQAPREILNGAKHLVAFALPTRGDLGLVAPPGPRVAQRAPLSKAGLIFEQDQAFTPLGRTENGWPLLLQPRQTLDCVEMVRDKACLLKRKAQVVQHRTHIMLIVEHAKLAPDQDPDEDRVPTGCLTTYHEWSGLDQLAQAFFLPRRQLWRTATTTTVGQTVHATQQKGLLPGIEA